MKCLPFSEHIKESPLQLSAFLRMLRALQKCLLQLQSHNNDIAHRFVQTLKKYLKKFVCINYNLYICIAVKKDMKISAKIFASVNYILYLCNTEKQQGQNNLNNYRHGKVLHRIIGDG